MKKKVLLTITLILVTVISFSQKIPQVNPTYISHSVSVEVGPLSDFNPISEEEWQQMLIEETRKQRNKTLKNRYYPFSNIALPKGNDLVWQQSAPTCRGANAPILVFEGTPSAAWPSDVNGSVSSSHYVQTTNSLYSIYDKSGTRLVGPNNINTIFSGVPGGAYNDGDPVVIFDDQADRWLLSEFSYTGPNDFLLVAISQTSDPTGLWYAYSFDVDDLPDYPKFGIWHDGYYIGINKGSTSIEGQEDVYVIERDKMILGQTAQIVGFENTQRPLSNFQLASPVDNDGTFASTSNPGMFVTINDDAWNGIKDQIWIYELDVDWTTTSNSTFQRVQAIDVAAFDSNFGNSRQNINQPNTSNKIDAQPEPIRNRPQYRNFGSHETIVLTHNVDVDGTDHAGMRWYELRRTDGDWEIRQQGTYAPDGNSRWMGSISMNTNQRIALGYSISSSSVYPGIRYAAQSPSAYSAANGTLDVAEEIILTGSYSQTVFDRWGDYTNMSIDPVNDTVFWYTNQYIGSAGERNTKIASFKFASFAINADFVASTKTPEINTTVQFTDLSYGDPTSWQWSFSPTTAIYVNGTSSTSQNPKVQFTATGNYNVTLVATKGGNNDSETKSNHIKVSPDCTIATFPWTEGFENSGSIPDCWTQQYVTIENRDWIFGAGNGGSNPAAAHTGSYNAYLKDGSFTDGKTKLITPNLDLSGLTSAQLNFWHTQNLNFSVNDKLNVYYKNSPTADWTQIADYTSATSSWKHDSLSLPNLSSTYYIAFEGNAVSGNGVCIDDVTVKSGQSCPFPINQQTTNIASVSCDLSWIEGGLATEWDIEWGVTGFTQGTGTTVAGITANPYTLTGLNPLTTYQWYVRAKCSPVNASIWTGPNSFTTTEQVYSLPVTENFEGGMVKFENASGNSVSWALETTLKHGGSKSVKNGYSSSNTNILHETGVMDLSSAVQPTLTFWQIGKTETDYDLCFVEVSTDGGSNYTTFPVAAYQGSATGYSTNARFDESSYTEWQGATPDNSWWKKEIFSLDNYKSSTVKIRFKLTSDGSIELDGWYIDDISIEVPTCPQPVSPSTSSITDNSAQLVWTEQGSAISWDVEYGINGFTQGNGTTISGTTNNPYSLSSLVASTSYDWYIRSSCGGGDYSSWVGPTSFSTSCVVTNVPYLEDFEGVTIPNLPSCMAQENVNGDNEKWKTDNTYSTSGNNCAFIYFNVLEASNDWLFTRGLQLTGGVEYECGFAYKAGSNYKTEKMEVSWGTSAISSSMTNGTIWQNLNITNNKFQLGSGTFTPPTTDTYYIGFHGISDINKVGVYVDDIYVHKSSNSATWTGTTDNDWWKPANWGNDTLPSSGTNVVIPVGLANYPTLSHIGPCNNFTLVSSAAGESSIIDKNLLLAQGQITVQRYLSGGKWHGISVPVNNATVNSLYFNGNPDVWLKSYNESNDTWTGITSLSTPMPFGAGFIVWVETGNNVTVNFIGTLSDEYLYLDAWTTPPINHTNTQHGYNLIGNPFTSALDWDIPGWDTTGIEGSIWVWNDATGNYSYRNSQGQGSLINGIIPMCQGFFIRTKTPNYQFGITQSARVHSNQAYYKSINNPINIPYIVIKALSSSLTDEAWVSFSNNATEEYDDGMDVRKMFSDFSAPQIYFTYNVDSLSIIAAPMLYNDIRIVDLNYHVGENGPQQLSLDEYNMMWDTDIFLEDLLLNRFIDFKDNPNYAFDAVTTDDPHRFKIHFSNIVTSTPQNVIDEKIIVYSSDGSIYVINESFNYENRVIWVFDLFGRMVANISASNRINCINNLPVNQYYIVKVLLKNSIYTKKVLLK